MELTDFAEQILFGHTLEDKLVSVSTFTDHHPSGLSIHPKLPARAPELKFASYKSNNSKPALTVHKLQDPMNRAKLLHIFANHELISLELMAFVLLRFPSAPKRFRRGVAQVMRDEQKHLQAYIKRITALGLEFGSCDMSDFFWRCVADAPTPHEWNARMGLVFEQANLDFTKNYKSIFNQIGDLESASTLEMIYRDELSHVKHSLHWFRHWTPGNDDEWVHFVTLLKPPLSPSRAKGTTFCHESRVRVGFSPRFIQALEQWGGSKSRPPTIWVPNFDVETTYSSETLTKKVVPDCVTDLTLINQNLAICLSWLTARGDQILCPAPSNEFQQQLLKMKGYCPEWVETLHQPKTKHYTTINPWGWSESIYSSLQPIFPKVQNKINLEICIAARQAASKLWITQLRPIIHEKIKQLGYESLLLVEEAKLFTSMDNLLEMFKTSSHKYVCKMAYGSAGRGHIIVDDKGLTPPQVGWLKRRIKYGGILVEIWQENRVLDLSFHGKVSSDGQIQYDGTVQTCVDHRGVFRGAKVNPPPQNVSQRIHRYLNGDGKDPRRLRKIAESVIQGVGKELYTLGYQGYFGVDAMLVEKQGHLFLQPLVEVNPRYTMGRLALKIRSLLSPRKNATIYFKSAPKNAGEYWSRSIATSQPLILDSQGRWTDGILPINDPYSLNKIFIYGEIST